MNREDIRNALEFSALSYGDIQPCEPGEKLIVIDDCPSGVQCYLRKKERRLSISFRGSDSPKDWESDFSFGKKTIPYDNQDTKIRVHEGFLRAYKSPEVRERIHGQVSQELIHICICGHSFGAALAILCAVDLQYCFPHKDIQVITFGCPRVGNQAFQRSFDKRVFKAIRVVNGNDIVTKLPFAFMGYRHVGGCIHVGPPRIWGVYSLRQHRIQDYYGSLLQRMLG